ncbi:hypothetical protein ABPG75_011542 [Micractinium tetrahymenae]
MLRPRHVSGAGAQQQASENSASFDQFLQTKVVRWHWPAAVLLSMGVIMLLTQVVPRDILPIPGGLRAGGFGGTGGLNDSIDLASLSEFERQLYGCRSLKSGPIPFVDTEASLAALDGLTEQQRQQADAYAAALAACTDFACLRRVNDMPRAPGQFHFPHFMVIGFPKCATTSIYCHLIQHLQVQHPREKESHWLSQQCQPRSLSCSPESQEHYLAEILNLPEAARYRFTKAAFEGSTHYVLEADWIAAQLAATFPWLRVVVALRDPISQAIAMHLHNVMHKREMNCTKEGNEASIYHCIRRALKKNSRSHYPSKIAKWMEHFPREQLHFLQYESLTSPGSMGGELASLKSFLGIAPALPSSQLPLTNYKHVHTGHGPDALGRYWVMKRWELEHLVEIARNNTMDTVKLLGKGGFASPEEKVEWLLNWERVWKDNLARCEEGRAAPCKVIVS